MYREFNVPLTTSFQDLYTLMKAVTGAIPTDGILPDRCKELELNPQADNTGDVTIADSQDNAHNAGYVLTNKSVRSNRNTICLRDYVAKGSDGAQHLVIEVEYA